MASADGLFRKLTRHLFTRDSNGCVDFSAYVNKLSSDLNQYVEFVEVQMTVGKDTDCWKNRFWFSGAPGPDKFKTLVTVARAALCLTISNAPLESAFSSLRRVDDSLSQRASTETLFA